ncbi:hypothetical protein CKO51_11960 [Rhodopirellula sp. SM50]|nr:hypothetical protein CKO51_11960 [Rhodopirellula sp. SM50]
MNRNQFSADPQQRQRGMFILCIRRHESDQPHRRLLHLRLRRRNLDFDGRRLRRHEEIEVIGDR